MFSVTNFMKYTAIGALITVAGFASYQLTRAGYDGSAGITYGSAYAEARGENVEFTIWYPAKAGGRAVNVGENGVFYGTPAGRAAPPADGQYPMVIISHGAGGNAGQFGWIAAALANEGFVVVLPNHPGTTTGNASAKAAVRVWERPKDVTAVLDEIMENPQSYPFIDTRRIGMLGFSAGGYTALAVAGARVDPDRLQRFCDTTDHGMSDCAFLAHFGVDLHSLDLSPAAQDLSDPRLSALVVVDPGIVSTLTKQSLGQITVPMMIINLGEEGTVPAGVDAKDAAKQIRNATYATVPSATHFSFLARCKPRGPAILAKEGELDPLCADGGAISRADLHHQLSRMIVASLRSNL